MRLDRLDHLPQALCDIAPAEIGKVLPRPTLITLAGRRHPSLFLSLLLHGNETTSFFVLQDLARRYARSPPPRSLLIFVGNVEAAATGQRWLEHQMDFNRLWAGGEGPLFDLAAEVTATARAARPFASIDIHNNTGTNPLYGCVSSMAPAHLQLAALFSRIGVYYRNPPTTQSVNFSDFCPAVTVECGRSGHAPGIARAIALVDDVMHLEHFPQHAPPASDLTLYRTVGRVVVEPDCSFAFGEGDAELQLRDDLERMNFTEMAAGAVWARCRGRHSPLRVYDETGEELTADFFDNRDGAISLRRAMTPSMITRDLAVIRQDCLCYLMSPLEYDPATANRAE